MVTHSGRRRSSLDEVAKLASSAVSGPGIGRAIDARFSLRISGGDSGIVGDDGVRMKGFLRRTSQIGFAGLLSIAVAYGFARYGYGLFVPVFRREFGLSTEVLGFIASASYISYLLAMGAAGVSATHLGPRFPVVVGGLSAGLGMACIALSNSVFMLVSGVLIASTSAGWSWAPFSDAVARMVASEKQDRTLSLISSGTTFGLTVAGPVALLADASWRSAWIAFASVALASTAWNAWLLPKGRHRGFRDGGSRPGWRWFVNRRSLPLFAVAFSYGLIAAFYFTYAVDLISGSGLPPAWAPLFWTLVGVAGVSGVFGGDLAARFGLRRVLPLTLVALGTSIGLLALASGSWTVVVSSAVLYGVSYMPVAAFLAIWSQRVFSEQPSTGFSAALLLLATGSVLGPATLGLVAGAYGLSTAFFVTAVLTAASAVFKPDGKTFPVPPVFDRASRVDHNE